MAQRFTAAPGASGLRTLRGQLRAVRNATSSSVFMHKKMKRKTLQIVIALALTQAALPTTLSVAQSQISTVGAPAFEIRADALQPYLEFKSTTLLDWHPITKQALVRTAGDTIGQQLQLVAGAGGKLTPLKADAIGRALFEPKIGSYLVYEKKHVARLFRLDVVTKAELAISPAAQHAGNMVFNRTGDHIVYTAYNATNDLTSTYLAAPLSPQTQRLLTTLKGDRYSDFNFAPDDKSLVYVQTISPTYSHVWHLNLATGSTKRLTPAANDTLQTPYLPRKGTSFGSWASPRHSTDGKSLFLLGDMDSDFKRLVKLDIASGKIEFLTEFAFDIDEFLISVRQNRIALLTNELGGNGLRFIDLTNFKELPRPPLMIGEMHGLRWRGALDADDSEGIDGIEANKKLHSARTELGFTLATARGPQDVFTAQVGGRITRWTNSASTNLNPMDFVEPSQISWKGLDGASINGLYYAPDPTKFPGKRPVIIKLPDDNATQFKPGFIGRDNYFINVLGIAVIYPNVRSTAGFGKQFLAEGSGEKMEHAIKDIGALLEWVAAQPALDAERIMLSQKPSQAVAGTSNTNTLATAVSTRYAGTVAKAEDIRALAKSIGIEPRTHVGKAVDATVSIRH